MMEPKEGKVRQRQAEEHAVIAVIAVDDVACQGRCWCYWLVKGGVDETANNQPTLAHKSNCGVTVSECRPVGR
jgi:hypothetical protein